MRIAVPRKGRALPLLQLAYDRDALPAGKSQNQLEQEALLAVLRALPSGVRPVVLADRGFGRAGLLSWLQCHGIDYVVCLKKGGCITETDGGGGGGRGSDDGGRQWKQHAARKGSSAGSCAG